MKTLRLKTVDAFVAFDFDCPTSAGGTRLAPDVTERETQLLARVDDPGIVRIFDVGHAPEGLYYVAELVDGESLARHLAGSATRIPDRHAPRAHPAPQQ